jgi:hypothetical protein
VAVVSDLIRNVGDLGFEGGTGVGGAVGSDELAVMFPESLQDLIGEVEPLLLGIALLEDFNYAEALLIVVKAPVILHKAVEGFLSSMAEGWVTEVVGEGNRLGKVLIESEGPSHGPTDGSDLYGVGETGAVVVSFATQEDLGLPIESTERCAMHDAVTIALKAAAEGVLVLGPGTSRGLRGPLRVGSEEIFAGIRGHGYEEGRS